MRRALLRALLAARADKRPVVLASVLDEGDPGAGGGQAPAQSLVYEDEVFPQGDAGDDIVAAARRALARGTSGSETIAGARVFLQVFAPPLRMVIVGAVHIAQTLAPMAALLGFRTVVVDPRRAFATGERFPEVEVTHEWPDEALARLQPDRRTAVVTLTHDPKLDDPALAVALGSPAFYVGSLGSRRTHAARLARLRKAGFDEAACARIHAPVGLAIGARSPAEIAAAIVAEIISVLRGGSAT